MEIHQSSPGNSGHSILLETNGVENGSQSILNLVQGTGITIVDDGIGDITISSTGGLSNITDLIFAGTDMVRTGSGTLIDPYILSSTGDGDEYNEFPPETVDGVNKIFTTDFNFDPGAVRPQYNGIAQALNIDYTETGDNQITFTTAPAAGSIIFLNYRKKIYTFSLGHLLLQTGGYLLLQNGGSLVLQA